MKLGHWAHVALELHPKNEQRSATQNDSTGSLMQGLPGLLQTLDSDGVPARYTFPPVVGSYPRSSSTYTQFGRADASTEFLEFFQSQEYGDKWNSLLLLQGKQAPVAVPSTANFFVEIGNSIGLRKLSNRDDSSNANGPLQTVVATIDITQPLPNEWIGYDGVDCLVLVASEAMRHGLIDERSANAIRQWVRLGGKLIVVCGDNAERLFAADSPLARFAPGNISQTVNLRQFGSLETFAETTDRLDANSPRLALRVPQIDDVRGTVELFHGAKASELPLVVRTPVGFGEITFVGLDLHQPPFTEWPGRERFLKKLLRRDRSEKDDSDKQTRPQQGLQLGYSDMAGQLRASLDHFAGVTAIPFWAIAGGAIAYVAVLFPFTYWLVVRKLNRPAAAWVVLPISMLVFALVAHFAAAGTKGIERRINRVELVDIDGIDGTERGHLWLSTFSPANETYSLKLSTDSGESPPVLGWFGMPGEGFGGMDARAAHPPLFAPPYTINPATGQIDNVPLAQWGSKAFLGQWGHTHEQIASGLTLGPDLRLRGNITNPLEVPLTDCLLLHGRWAYTVGKLTPGQKLPVDRLPSRTIETWLTRRRLIGAREEAEKYDRTDTNPARILEVMMFYEAAGGENYTGLTNRVMPRIDLSSQLEEGRAVLVGRGPPRAEVSLDNKPLAEDELSDDYSVYRMVLEVGKR